MKKLLPAIIILFFGSLTVPLSAEQTAYITDSLHLRVYAEPSDASEVIETLESGDSIEVLESREEFSQIRSHNGTPGWVKSAFLVNEPPAKLLYYSASEQNQLLEQQIEDLKYHAENLNRTNTDQITELKQALVEQRQANQLLQNQVNSLTQNNGTSVLGIGDDDFNLRKAFFLNSKIFLVIIGLLITMGLLGFLLGIKHSNNRMRIRLHGYRLD